MNNDEKYGSKFINVIRKVGWLNLIFSIICSIVIWDNYGVIYGGNFTRGNPLFICIGFAIIFMGINILVAMKAIAYMLENRIAVTKYLTEEKTESL